MQNEVEFANRELHGGVDLIEVFRYGILKFHPLVAPMYLRSHLTSDFSSTVRKRGSDIYAAHGVKILEGDRSEVLANVQGSHLYAVTLSRKGGDFYVACDCPYFESDGPCKHIWATILAAENRNYLLGFGGRLRLVDGGDEDFDDLLSDDFEIPAPGTRSWPASGQKSQTQQRNLRSPAWRDLLSQVRPVSATKVDTWGGVREVYYLIDLSSTSLPGIPLEVNQRERKQNGEWGKLKTNRISRAVIPQIPDELDREILTVLGGAPDPYSYQPELLPCVFRLKHSVPHVLLPKICATGRCRLRLDNSVPLESMTPLAWDNNDPWQFRLLILRRDSNWILSGQFRRGEEHLDLAEPTLFLEDGFLIARGFISRFEHGGASGWLQLLRKEGHVKVPLTQGNELVEEILSRPNPPSVDWPEELRFEHVESAPHPSLRIEQAAKRYWTKKDNFEATLSFSYDGNQIPEALPAEGFYDASNRRYLQRDRTAESGAIAMLRQLGFLPATRGYSSSDAGWELTPKKLPTAVRELVKAGWHIEAEGKMFRRPNSFRAEITSGIDWFELHGEVDYGSGEVKLPELLKAIQKGEEMVRLDDGTFGIIPDEILERYGMLVRFGQSKGDHIQFSRAQAGLLDVLLAERPEIEVDQVFARAREELRRFEGIEAAPQPAGFSGELRGYQCEGLGWMHFLRRFGFGGCLADDMGVGKTPQVLALLETRRQLRATPPPVNGGGAPVAIGPSLVVVPRTLVYNWKQEAARFCPQLRVLDHTGVDREKDVRQFKDHDVILTTYGTMRRDVIDLQKVQFDYAVLDEAQAIKNASSESAKAARLLNAKHRLAMSGTPVENHLGELWSLFEFLNPGMLGSASVFQSLGGATRNPDEQSRQLLAKAVRPFILRRTKDQVATELPAKLEQTLFCELDPVQRKLYDDLRDHFRRELLKSVEEVGIAKSKIKILEALLRLRQAACHPGLIDKKRTGESSAKLDMLLPQLSQVLEEGHKALVFSQFTSMLSIVRQNLDREGIVYEYLDGKTRDRQTRVERFQNDPDCKLFLVSLKAGGVGLNLTAAEYVFLLDPWWNPAVEAQAIDRAHRIGQSRRVFAYRLIARGTVEEKVLQLQAKKHGLAEAIINANNRLVGSMKREDLELLFS